MYNVASKACVHICTHVHAIDYKCIRICVQRYVCRIHRKDAVFYMQNFKSIQEMNRLSPSFTIKYRLQSSDNTLNITLEISVLYC